MDPPGPSDGHLIKRYLGGDDAAFNVLYERYRRQLYSYLNRLLPGRHAVVDDLYQQTWLRILDALPGYREKDRFLSWALRIAHNLAMDVFRREARRETVEVDEKWAAHDPPPWSALDQQELKRAVTEAIDRLPPLQREVVLLRQQGVPFREIAVIQGANINTVLGRMHYAVKKLRKELAWLIEVDESALGKKNTPFRAGTGDAP